MMKTFKKLILSLTILINVPMHGMSIGSIRRYIFNAIRQKGSRTGITTPVAIKASKKHTYATYAPANYYTPLLSTWQKYYRDDDYGYEYKQQRGKSIGYLLAVGAVSPFLINSFTDNSVYAEEPSRVDCEKCATDPQWYTNKTSIRIDNIQGLLHNNNATNEALIELIMLQYPHLAEIYNMPAAPRHNHSLKTHTVGVLNNFQKIKKFFNFETLHVEHITNNIESLMRAMILVHDIGKPLGDPETQHERTTPIAQAMLKAWGFKDKEIQLALTLIDNDIIGQMVQPYYEISAQDAYDKLEQLAKQTGVDLQTYYQLQTLFYLSDASWYPYIRKHCMITDKSGFLYPKDPQFEQLYKLIFNQEQ